MKVVKTIETHDWKFYKYDDGSSIQHHNHVMGYYIVKRGGSEAVFINGQLFQVSVEYFYGSTVEDVLIHSYTYLNRDDNWECSIYTLKDTLERLK